jgi:hypothetical protein
MAVSFTHPLTDERKITFPEHIKYAESLVLSLAFVVFGVGCYSRHELWAGTIISTVDEMDCGYSLLAQSVTSLQITVHISLSLILSFSESVLFFYFAAVFSRPVLVSPIAL